MKNILLTGKPGVGKTTLIRKLVGTELQISGGFYTEEICEKGRRVGFRIRALSGAESVLAHVNSKSKYRVSKYGVNVEAFEKVGVKSIEDALRRSGIVVMDEIGRMELYSRKFQESVLKALDADNLVLGVIQKKSNPFLNRIRARQDVEVIEITYDNRDNILKEIKERLLQYKLTRQ